MLFEIFYYTFQKVNQGVSNDVFGVQQKKWKSLVQHFKNVHYALNALQLFMIIDREPLLLSDLVFTIEVEHFDKHIC